MQHAVITGASSGIGEAVARELARSGWRVTLVARRKERLESIAGELGPPATAFGADLCAIDDFYAWFDAIERQAGPVDLLVNNAGTVAVGPFTDIDPGEAHRVVTSLPTGTAATLARRIRRAVERRRARVIYPRPYALVRYFPAIVRRMLDWLTPPPLSRSSP